MSVRGTSTLTVTISHRVGELDRVVSASHAIPLEAYWTMRAPTTFIETEIRQMIAALDAELRRQK